jgi:hypothetical protein
MSTSAAASVFSIKDTMGCGLCKHTLLKSDTDLTLRTTGQPKYDCVFRELKRPLYKVQQARELLSSSLFAFKTSVGLYPRMPLSTFLDAVLAMLLCYSASCAGKFDAIGLVLTSEVPYLLVNIDSLQREHSHIPEKWQQLLRLAEQIRLELENLTPIITAAANDMLSTDPLRSSRDTSRRSLSPRPAPTLSISHAAQPQYDNNSTYSPE